MASYKIPNGKELRIAISGQSGCGNTTLSKLISDTLGIAFINFTFRSLASEMNIPLAQIIERAKNDDSFDLAVDKRQTELARKSSCVLGSRLAIWMLPEADFKIYLCAKPETRANRILTREGGDLAQIMSFTAMRDAEDTRRYKQLYDIDNTKFDFVDLVVPTDTLLPDQIQDLVFESLIKKNLVIRA